MSQNDRQPARIAEPSRQHHQVPDPGALHLSVPDPAATTPRPLRRGEQELGRHDELRPLAVEGIFDDSRVDSAVLAKDDVLRRWDPARGEWVAEQPVDELSNTYAVGAELPARPSVGGFSFPDTSDDDPLLGSAEAPVRPPPTIGAGPLLLGLAIAVFVGVAAVILVG